MVDAKQVYQDSVVRGATPIELVILLFDSAIEDIRQAVAAMKTGDIEARTKRIGHALIILQQLQGTLDFERGGGPAKQFEQFYNVTRGKLLEAQIRSSVDLMLQQIRHMSEVRSCWAQARRILEPRTVPAAMPSVAANSDEDRSTVEWNA